MPDDQIVEEDLHSIWGNLPNELWFQIINFSSTDLIQKISIIKPELFILITDFFTDYPKLFQSYLKNQPEIQVPYFKSIFANWKKLNNCNNIYHVTASPGSILQQRKVILFELYNARNLKIIRDNYGYKYMKHMALYDTLENLYNEYRILRTSIINHSNLYPCVFVCMEDNILTGRMFEGLEKVKSYAYPAIYSQLNQTVFPSIKSFTIESFIDTNIPLKNVNLPNCKYFKITKTQFKYYQDINLPQLKELEISLTYQPIEIDDCYKRAYFKNINIPNCKSIKFHRASTFIDYQFQFENFFAPNLQSIFLSSIDFYKNGSVDISNDLERVLDLGISEKFLQTFIPFLLDNKPKLVQLDLFDIKTLTQCYETFKQLSKLISIEVLNLGLIICPYNVLPTEQQQQFRKMAKVDLPPSLEKLSLSQMNHEIQFNLDYLTDNNNIKDLEYTVRSYSTSDLSLHYHLHHMNKIFTKIETLTLNYYETNSQKFSSYNLVFPEIEICFPKLREFYCYSTHIALFLCFCKESHLFKGPKLEKIFLSAVGDYKNVYDQFMNLRNLEDDIIDYDMDMGDLDENYYVPNTITYRSQEEREIIAESDAAMNYYINEIGITRSDSLLDYQVPSPGQTLSFQDNLLYQAIKSFEILGDFPQLKECGVFGLYFERFNKIDISRYPNLEKIHLLRNFDGLNKIYIDQIILHELNKGKLQINPLNQLTTEIGEIIYLHSETNQSLDS
ncbi:hypothetical protein WICMUC_003407 [Wickerhamomyces mucosus]|uniref:Uncharacterized protein n=1 Tax=Wickerhamomyces mucosus TaxID=1378264 RepID=A0A9P8PN41_9ASCO|nr:hypothetical protein WICMUC_003407 [Wickerhamomyces mucosus]